MLLRGRLLALNLWGLKLLTGPNYLPHHRVGRLALTRSHHLLVTRVLRVLSSAVWLLTHLHGRYLLVRRPLLLLLRWLLLGMVLNRTLVRGGHGPLLPSVPWVQVLVLLEPELRHLCPASLVRFFQEFVWSLIDVRLYLAILVLPLGVVDVGVV